MRFTVIFLLTFYCSLGISKSVQDDSSSTKKKRRFLILPFIIHSPETRTGGGALASIFFKTKEKDSTIRTSNIEAVGIYTQRSQIVIQNGGNLYFPHEKYIIRWYSSYAYFPDRFWGLGDNTPASNKEIYTYKQLYLSTQMMRKVYKRLFIGIDYEFQDVLDIQYPPNGIFDTQNVLGRYGSLSSGIGPLIAWDSRNNAFSPTKGEFLKFSIKQYGPLTGSQYNFANYFLDFRKFIRSFKNNVLAFQILGQATSGTAPFRELPPLGGPFMMRGYYMGRFRDKNYLAAQVEYRLHVWRRFGLVGFTSAGEVSNAIKNFYFDGIKYAVGAGIRFALIPKERLNLRLDFAKGEKNNAGFYLYIMEAF